MKLFSVFILYLEMLSRVTITRRNVTMVCRILVPKLPLLRWSLVNSKCSNIVSSREVDTSSVKGTRSQAYPENKCSKPMKNIPAIRTSPFWEIIKFNVKPCR